VHESSERCLEDEHGAVKLADNPIDVPQAVGKHDLIRRPAEFDDVASRRAHEPGCVNEPPPPAPDRSWRNIPHSLPKSIRPVTDSPAASIARSMSSGRTLLAAAPARQNSDAS